MKKLTILIALLLVTISLTACGNSAETFKITNFSISRITTVYNESTQYDSNFNADSTNTSLFSNAKEKIGEFEVTMITKMDDIVPFEDQIYITIQSNNGDFEIYKATFIVDGEESEYTIIEFGEDSAAYADTDMYDDLKDLF